MNTEDIKKPTEIAREIADPEDDEPLIVDEEEAAETEQIKAELREREGKLSHEGM